MNSDRPRHLFHVFPSFAIGGSQMRLATLISALGPGYRHTIVSLSGVSSAMDLIAPGLAVEFTGPVDQGGALPARLWKNAGRLWRERPDLLLTYTFGAIECALANLVVGRPHIHFEDGFGPDEAFGLKPHRGTIRRFALARSRIVAPSRKLYGLAQTEWKFSPERVRYIPNGIEAKNFTGVPLEPFGVPDRKNAVRIAWAGAFRPEKNPARLIRALAKTSGSSVLVLIGEGPERPHLEAEIDRLGLRSRVFFTGARTDVRELVASCDILSLSSDTEQMPYVVLEAMDAAKPVASVDVGDVKVMLSGANNPYVVPLDEDRLAQALQSLSADPELRREVGLANQRRVRAVFSLEAMVTAYEALFRSVMTRKAQA